MMRQFALTDLIWLEPIAKQYDQWEPLLWMLDRINWSYVWVQEPHCLICVYLDDGKRWIVALTSHAGVKHMIRMGAKVVEACRLPLYAQTHIKPGTWRGRILERLGFTYDGEVYVKEDV